MARTIICWWGLSLILLSLYDIILVKALKLKMPLIRVFRVSYIINALNSIIGFGGFIGAGVRAFVYKIILMTRKTCTIYFYYFSIYAYGIKFIIHLSCPAYI